MTLPTLRQEAALITLTGTSPLLVHKFSDAQKDELEAKQGGAAKPLREYRVPVQEAEEALYVCADGRFGFPANAIKICLVDAAGRFGSATKTVLRGALSMDMPPNVKEPWDGLIPLETDGWKMQRDHVRLAGIGRTPTLRYRPRFDVWALHVPVQFLAAVVSTEQLVNLFNLAGFTLGIGEWRPERDGIYGRFRVTKVAAYDPARREEAYAAMR